MNTADLAKHPVGVATRFAARRASQCDRCCDPIDPGDIVIGNPTSGYGYVHAECAGRNEDYPGIERYGRKRPSNTP